MTSRLDPSGHSSRARGYAPSAHVVHTLKKWIEEGVLVSGQPIPSERVLSAQLGVARKTVRRAIQLMEDDGALQSRNGRLRVVAPPAPLRSRLIAESVGIITKVGGSQWVQHRQSGWSEYITHGATHAIREAGLHAISLQPERLGSLPFEEFLADAPLGLILTDLTGAADAELLRWAHGCRAAGVPVVIYGGHQAFAEYDRVLSDHESGAYQITRWLLENGRRRIQPLWASPLSNYWYQPRRLGYERALREAGVDPLDTFAFQDSVANQDATEEVKFQSSVENYVRAFTTLGLRGIKFDALMLDSDGSIPYAAVALQILQMAVNRDVLLAGYDNYWQEGVHQARADTPPVITVDKNNLRIGATLVELLLDRIHGRIEVEREERLIQPTLILTRQNL